MTAPDQFFIYRPAAQSRLIPCYSPPSGAGASPWPGRHQADHLSISTAIETCAASCARLSVSSRRMSRSASCSARRSSARVCGGEPPGSPFKSEATGGTSARPGQHEHRRRESPLSRSGSFAAGGKGWRPCSSAASATPLAPDTRLARLALQGKGAATWVIIFDAVVSARRDPHP